MDPRDSVDRLSGTAIRAARLLLMRLKTVLPGISFIHPHGQFNAGKADRCPGPDIWVNVGEWACEALGLQADAASPGRSGDLGISPQQRNYDYIAGF